jgi:NAD(P)-dependent dehydrogenase (short-subunit alcohol dehydrogenase family)
MDPDLQGKVVFVTGAARGMGRTYVEGFLDDGCKVVASDVSWAPTGQSHDGAADFKQQLDDNPNALALDLDITDDAQLAAARDRTVEAFGTVHVLVNNGAKRMNTILASGRIDVLDMDMRDFERMMDINVNGVVKTIRVLAPLMIAQGSGSIVNISGGNGGTGGDGPYGASKAGIVNLTLTLASELRKHNIAVNAIHPAQPRSHGYEEQVTARAAEGVTVPPPVRIEAHLPPVRLLAKQDAAGGLTGQILDVRQWNMQHGLGGFAE